MVIQTSAANSIAAVPSDWTNADYCVADFLVECLDQVGSRFVFGVPGGAVEPIYNALARSEQAGGIRAIVARHESGAAFMADGFARETGKIGVCIATSGPGTTNLITGVACAYENEVPLLVITGQSALPTFGRAALQESACTGINTVEMLRHCTRYSSLVSHPQQLKPKLLAALKHATQTPGGPVHLSIPVDILRSPIHERISPNEISHALYRPNWLDQAALEAAEAQLATATRVVFLLGSGAGAASGDIMALAEHIGALFITTPDGKGLVNCEHAGYRGVFGFAGHASAAALVQSQPEVVVAFGVKFNEWCSGAWSENLLNSRLIHIDANPAHFALSCAAGLQVAGDLRSICHYLTEHLPHTPKIMTPLPTCVSVEVASHLATTKPQALMRELGLRFPPTTRFVADAGNSMAWAIHGLQLRDRRTRHLADNQSHPTLARQRNHNANWLRVTMDFAPMGWAIGAAVGMAQGQPNSPVVCLTGDGSYLMSGQEITVAAEQGLTVIFVILNDSAYGMVKHGQRLAGAESIGWQLPTVDYCQLARSLGIPGHVIETPADFDLLDFDALLKRPGPTLLDIRIDGEEVPPMGLRMQTLGSVAELQNTAR